MMPVGIVGSAHVSAAGGVPLTLSYIGRVESMSDLTTYSFPASSLGAADADRQIVCVVASRRAGTTSNTIVSASIGGVSASIDLEAIRADTNSSTCAIIRAAVPTGTTGTVAVTFAGSMLRCAIGIYRIVGAGTVSVVDSEAVTATGGSTTTSPALTTAGDGVVIAGLSSGVTSGTPSATWSEATENYDGVPEIGYHVTWASVATTGASVAPSVTTGHTPAEKALAAVTYGGS